MNYLKDFTLTILAMAVSLSLAGCFCDSIQPWLDQATVMERELDFEGEWELINDDFKDKYAVTLEKNKDPRSKDLQSYYIKVSPTGYQTRFHFSGVVHQVNNIKVVQIQNFSHYHDDLLSLANRPTVSLWMIAYDRDNIIMWAPQFILEKEPAVKIMSDSDGKPLFIDSTENLQKYVFDWTEDYPQICEGIRNIMPIILSRQGTEFTMPAEMKDLVPDIYDSYLKRQE